MTAANEVDELQRNFTDFTVKVNCVVADYLKIHTVSKGVYQSEGKVINDPIWGCVKFTNSEIAIIDTPLFQRLRDIYQVGLGLYTYPSARHSRFEHSLGTVAIASRMVENLKSRTDKMITENDVKDVRFAALLHDIGHCFYSHLSETYYSSLPEFVFLLRYFNITFGVKPKAHEVLSYLIVTSDAFKKFAEENDIFDDNYIAVTKNIDELMVRIGNIIIGVKNNGREDTPHSKTKMSFLTGIINGDIDADKLDYIKRDSHTSGLPLTFDTERLLYKMNVRQSSDGKELQLVVDIAGITAVEEITFSKLMLNNYLYHHQKILATETMAKDIAFALIKLGDIKHPADFLRYTDKTIEALVDDARIPFADLNCQNNVGHFVRQVKDRYLPKRCFEINSRVIEPVYFDDEREEQQRSLAQECLKNMQLCETDNEKVDLLIRLSSDLFEFTDAQKGHMPQLGKFINKFTTETYEEHTKNIRQTICKEICLIYKTLNKSLPKEGISAFDVHIVIPKSADEHTKFSTPIVYRDEKAKTPTDMMEYTNHWAQAFNTNKWCGYVFVSPHIDITIAFKATLIVLTESFGGMPLTNPEHYVKNLDQAVIAEIDSILSQKCVE